MLEFADYALCRLALKRVVNAEMALAISALRNTEPELGGYLSSKSTLINYSCQPSNSLAIEELSRVYAFDSVLASCHVAMQSLTEREVEAAKAEDYAYLYSWLTRVTNQNTIRHYIARYKGKSLGTRHRDKESCISAALASIAGSKEEDFRVIDLMEEMLLGRTEE